MAIRIDEYGHIIRDENEQNNTSSPVAGSSETSGMPPASEMMSGLVAAANSMRTADGRILVMRVATLSVAVSNLMCASFMPDMLALQC